MSLDQLLTLVELMTLNALLAYSAYIVLSGGTFSLGFVAFVGVGLYTGALLYVHTGLGMLVAVPVAVAIALVVALLVSKPLARLSGIYLAIATVSLVAVTQVVLVNWRSFTNGTAGIYSIPLRTELPTLLACLALLVVVLRRIDRSSLGRAIRMTRLDPLIAGAMGLDVPRLRLQLLLASSALAAAAGVLRVYYFGFTTPQEVGFTLLVQLLAMVLLGGVEHWSGPLIGAAVFTFLPELLSPLGPWREVANGIALLIVVIGLPNGISGTVVKAFRSRRAAARKDEVATLQAGAGAKAS